MQLQVSRLAASLDTITLHHPLLAAPSVPRFLELGPPELCAFAPESASSAVGEELVRCMVLRKLTCFGGLLPTAYPPGLTSLDIVFTRFSRPQRRDSEELDPDKLRESLAEMLQQLREQIQEGCREPDKPYTFPPCTHEPARQSQLVTSLQGLPSLTELSLHFGNQVGEAEACPDPEVELYVGAELAQLPSLRLLRVELLCAFCTQSFDVHGFGAAAAAGVRVELGVSFAGDCPTPARERLWYALGKAAPVSQLCLTFEHVGELDEDVNALEKRLLPSVRCTELLLLIHHEHYLCASLLPRLDFEVAQVSFIPWANVTLPWSALSSRSGVYIVSSFCSLTIMDCNGRMPEFEQGWALVLRQEEQERVKGLPLSAFRLGSRGSWVWGDSPALHAAELGSLG